MKETFQDIVDDRADTEMIVKDIENLIKKYAGPLTVVVILGGNQCYQQVLYKRG